MEKEKPDNILVKIECKGQIPPARLYPTATRVNTNVVVVFGGSNSKKLADTHCLDLRT